MKSVIYIIMAWLIMATSAWSISIDEEIKAIQTAPVEKRFELMNAFKKKLVQMKEKERIHALKELTKDAKKQDASAVLEALKKHTQQQKARQNLENEQIEIDNIQNDTQAQNEGADRDD